MPFKTGIFKASMFYNMGAGLYIVDALVE